MVLSNCEFVKNGCRENHISRNGVNKFFAFMSHIFETSNQDMFTEIFTLLAYFWKSAERKQLFIRSIN